MSRLLMCRRFMVAVVLLLMTVLAVVESQPTPDGYYDCGELSAYAVREYSPSEKVVHNDQAFLCKKRKVELCGRADAKYEPGVGEKSQRAWTSLGPCSAGSGSRTGEIVSFAPTDDAVVRRGGRNPSSRTDVLFVDADKQFYSFLKFDISGISGWTVRSATLRLFAIEKKAKHGGTVAATLESNWDEDTLGWEDAPSDLADLGSLGSDTKPDQWYEVDVTAAVLSDSSVTFRLAPESADRAMYCPRECADPSKAPQLVVELGSNDDKTDSTPDCKGAGIDVTSYDYQDNVPALSFPPASLNITDAPQFVSLTFDDNGYSGLNGVAGGMNWAVEMLANKTHDEDNTRPRATFFHTSQYISDWMYESPTYVKRAWSEAKAAGHEVGLHSHDHSQGDAFTSAEWTDQIEQCHDWLTMPFDPNEDIGRPNENAGIGASASEVNGWRTPFLAYNENLFEALVDSGVWYDASIEDGWQWDQDGTNYHWPYTLDEGSPGHEVFVGWGSKAPLDPQPGLWEMPLHPFIVPPDSVATQYGISPGLRRKCKSLASWFDESSGKITGFDYNLLVQFRMTAKEFSATLKFTLDLRLRGNRAPFFVGLHSDTYSDAYTAADDWSTAEERRQALSDFVDYTLSKSGVRMVPARDVLNWVRDPIPLPCLLEE